LAYIEDAPPLISVLGNRHLLTKKAIAVVGAAMRPPTA
jgi:predicted Rossmann fold nucleotide-binding protein DprA/Smf involved in DNA uptake